MLAKLALHLVEAGTFFTKNNGGRMKFELDLFGRSVVLACFSLVFSMSATAEESGSPITTEISYIGESVKNFSGGVRQGTVNLASGMLDVTVDSAGIGWWDNGTIFIESLVDQGNDPSAVNIGDFQTASNIADMNRTRLQQVWIEQRFMDDRFAILLGTHDLNSEFDVSEYGALFTNSSFGIGPEISANMPTSLFPEAGLAARAAFQVDENISFRVAGYDGDPATRQLKGVEGYLYIAEGAWASGETAYKFGLWRHTKAAVSGGKKGLNGGYLVIDQPFTSWNGGALGGFLQYGVTQASKALEAKSYIGAGIHANGVFSGREDDEFGLAFARANFSKDYETRNPGFKKSETAIEVTYKLQVTDWLSIQPSYQYIVNPSGDPALSNASVGLLRAEIAL